MISESKETRDLLARAASCLPGGVNSNVRKDCLPIVFERGQGAWLWDVDGHNYIDYLLGQGPAFLGHAHAKVVEAVERACRAGMLFGSRHPLEVEAAERVCDALKWPEMVRFGLTGTEMVQAALRLARAATGRRRFIRFEGHYHGWLDNVLIEIREGEAVAASNGQLTECVKQSIVLPWNDETALRAAFAESGDEIAAVIMEPMMLNTGGILAKPGYLQTARELCDEYSALLIFDEVITGFRLALGGCAERFGIHPDLGVYGKAMGGGYPVAALAGRREFMELFDTGTNHSGTFNANVMSMAATVAALDVLSSPGVYDQVEAVGKRLMSGLADVAGSAGLPLHIQGLPMAFSASVGEQTADFCDFRQYAARDAGAYVRLAESLGRNGVWVAGRGVWYVSIAHGDKEVEETLLRTEAAIKALWE